MPNPLITTAFIKREAERMAAPYIADATARNEAILKFLLETGVGPEDIVVEMTGYFPKPTYRVRLRTTEERWLNWQSDNHGWGTPDEDYE